jgi:bacterioferritin
MEKLMQKMNSESQPFLSDIKKIRERARTEILKGAVTQDYQGDAEQAVKILNHALATEIVCVLRYTSHYFLAVGIHSEAVKEEFMEHANEEREHVEWLAERIKQLNGEPDFNPEGLLSRSHSEFKNGRTLVELIKEDLVAERIAIESYREMIRYFGEYDSTTRKLLESILEKEEEHADEMADLLKAWDPAKPQLSVI